MSDPDYVIAQRYGTRWPFIHQPIINLPAAEHIHVTRHPDGTITATPMRRLVVKGIGIGWVDCPTGGDQERGA